MKILDFGFWILDYGGVTQSKIENLKSKIHAARSAA